MDQKQIREQKEKWMNKYFNYAEAPVKEWIASFLNLPVETVFSDFKNNKDIFIALDNNKSFAFSLEVESDDKKVYFNIDHDVFMKSSEFRKAVSVMHDSIYNVYGAVLQTMDKKYQEQLMGLAPRMHEEKMSFSLFALPKKAYEKQMALQTLNGAVDNLKKMNELPESDKKTEIYKKLCLLRNEQMVIISTITNDVIEEEKKQNDIRNKELFNKKHLFISATDNFELDATQLMKRLPEIECDSDSDSLSSDSD